MGEGVASYPGSPALEPGYEASPYVRVIKFFAELFSFLKLDHNSNINECSWDKASIGIV